MGFVLWLMMVGAIPGEPGKLGPIMGTVVDPKGRAVAVTTVVAACGEWGGQASNIAAQGTTDGSGRFALEVAPDFFVGDHPTLWAFRPGWLVARRAVDRAAGVGSEVRLVLAGESRGLVVVAGPDGRPVAGARVIPVRLARSGRDLPEAIGSLTAGTTDGEGRAVIAGFWPEDLVGLRVEAAGFGVQPREFSGPDGLAGVGTKTVGLRAVGRAEGRVIADALAGSSAAGLTVRLVAEIDGVAVGRETVRTDPNGRFEVATLAAGTVTARVEVRPGSLDLPTRIARRTLEAGGIARFEIPLRRGVRVSGTVRDRDDGRPIAGARVVVVSSGPISSVPAVSDLAGRFEAIIPAGPATHRVLQVPEPYLAPPEFFGPRPVEVPPAIVGFELPPIELTRGTQIRGSVVDAQGQPAAGARVEAAWTMTDGRSRVTRTASAWAGGDGSFVVGPVASEAELSLTAGIDGASTASPVLARASDGRPVRLTVADADSLTPVGRVVDADGQPVAGATVRIDVRDRSPVGSIVGVGPLSHGDRDWLTTDRDGRFQGPRRVRRGREYRASAVADGHGPVRSRYVAPPAGGDALTFPDLVLDRVAGAGALTGRILDRQGRPVAGATVWTSAQTPGSARATTAADGAFALDRITPGGSFLFAAHPGSRFAGRVVEAGQRTADLVVVGLGEAPDRLTPVRRDVAAASVLAGEILVPYASQVFGEGDHATRTRTLEVLARVQPKRVLTWIATGNPEDAWLADHLRQVAARGLVGSGPDEVGRVIDAIGDNHRRALAALGAADALPAVDRAAKGFWIDRALREAEAIADPADRVATVAAVAHRLLDLGKLDRATKLLEATRPSAERLAKATAEGRARGEFACCLARVDPDGALALIRDLVDPAITDACRVKIALALATRDPVAAARLVATIRDPHELTRGLPALCHALAPIDPAGARTLLRSTPGVDPCLTPYALGMMALAVAPANRAAATDWLRDAFDRLEAGANAGLPPTPGIGHDPAVIAAALLPVAERVDPSLVPELLWRAVSFHGRRPDRLSSRTDAVLALLLARYDHHAALVLFDPLVAHPAEILDGEIPPLLAAAALLNPALAVRLLEGLPTPPDLAFHHPKNAARLALAAALARELPWNHATAEILQLWTAGE